MPIYEYECRSCGHQFEYLTRGGQSPNCPTCEGGDLQKRLSAFAVSASRDTGTPARETAGSCGMCGDPRGPGACSMN